jgi:type VI secretion system secreted protein Hcp
MPIYMNYNKIPGDVTEDGHTRWIELGSFQFGVGRRIGSPTGASANRESSAASLREISVGKARDVASIKLFNEALQGEGQTVQIDFCKTDQGKLEVYGSYTLTNCMISGYTVSSGGDRPMESLTLNFTKLEMKNVEMGADGNAGSPESIAYDLALAKVV